MDLPSGRINGLDLFSGIGGITKALSPWVRPISYCENDPYAQAVLISRMQSGELPVAAVWDDVRTLQAHNLAVPVDIIYGGFPCQDISVAGAGKGLAGKRSGLFFEIIRLVDEARPTFVFLENVPAIRTRGLSTVIKAFSDRWYDCRWTTVSAQEVGAPHKRERWFMLAAHSDRIRLREQSGRSCGSRGTKASFLGINGEAQPLADSNSEHDKSNRRCMGEAPKPTREQKWRHGFNNSCSTLANPKGIGRIEGIAESEVRSGRHDTAGSSCAVADANSAGLEIWKPWESGKQPTAFGESWWEFEPDVDRVVNGLPNRVDRIKCLGNAVVPRQAREAFKILLGLSSNVVSADLVVADGCGDRTDSGLAVLRTD